MRVSVAFEQLIFAISINSVVKYHVISPTSSASAVSLVLEYFSVLIATDILSVVFLLTAGKDYIGTSLRL